MNKALPVLLAIVTAGFGVALYVQIGKTDALRRQLAVQQEHAAVKEAEVAQETVRLREQNEVFKSESAQLREKLATVAKAPPPAPVAEGAKADEKKEEGNWMKGFAKMFTDPEMKKAMRSQQAFGIRMMYGDLGKELGLTIEESNLIIDLLADRQMEISAKALGGDADPTKIEADAAGAKEAAERYEAEIKNILGEERMKKFKDFERTTGERMVMQQYQQSLTAAGMPLDDGQRKSLLGIMTEERLKQPPSKFEPGTKDVAGAMKAMRTGEGLEQVMAQQRELNQRVLDRARTILSADQTNAFEAAQKQMLEMQEMGVKMGKAMMSGGKK